MQKETLILILAGVLGCAAALAWRHVVTTAPRTTTHNRGETADLRVSDYDARIEALSHVDEALILYRETATITPPGLDTLTAVAVDGADRIYAGGGRRVVVMSSDGAPIRTLDVEGEVSCLAVDAEGWLFVGLGATIQAFDPDGAPVAQFQGLGPDAIITSLAVVGERVFAADAGGRRVLRFSRDGVLELTINGRHEPSDRVGFVIPSGAFDITAGQGQTVWIVNPGRLRLEEYTVNGERIRTWEERPGMGVEDFCGCCNPTHIARLRDGSIVTSEKGLARIKVYTARGRFVGVVAAPAQFDGHDAGLDLAVDAHDRILAVDSIRGQIRVFERR